MFALPNQVSFALNALNAAGYEAYIVGGCVRDILRKKAPSDYDITTSAEPEQTKAVFTGEKIIETGLKHGTVTLLKSGMPLEITTYRIDGDYADNRRPNSVQFTKNLTEDLARRDFTINAMAFSEKTGVIDPFGGKDDLKRGIIRSVGDADLRFNEDALRIMRAIRFASVLEFEIEEKTKKSILKNRNLLKNISYERIAAELIKLLTGKNARRIILEYFEVLEVILPELSGITQSDPQNSSNAVKTIAGAVENAPATPVLRLAALFCLCNNAKAALSRLRLDNSTLNEVLSIINHLNMPLNASKISVKRAMNLLTPNTFFGLLEVKKAIILAQNSSCENKAILDIEKSTDLAKKIIENREVFTLKELAVGGKDLMEFGIPAGKGLGEKLELLLNAVITEKTENTKQALLKYLSENR